MKSTQPLHRARQKVLRWLKKAGIDKTLVLSTPHGFQMWTENYHYFLSVTNDYISLAVNARAQRPGEHWVRGSDLHVGPFNEATFNRILGDIVRFELLQPCKNRNSHDCCE